MVKRRSDNWKAVERAIAALLGGVRVPVSGRTRGDNPDIAHTAYSIEVKHSKNFPKWILGAFDQADKSHKIAGQRSIVVLHPKNTEYRNAIVMVRLSDFTEMEQDDGDDD